MMKLLRHCVCIVILLCAAQSCSKDNTRRVDSDGMLRINLDRAFISKHCRYVGNAAYYDDGRPKYEESTAEVMLDAVFDDVDDCEELLGMMFVAVIIVGVAATVDGIDELFTSTKVYIWPRGYKKQYRQRLYWGKNYFYYPQEFKNTTIPIDMMVKGDRIAYLEFDIDEQEALTKRQLTMKDLLNGRDQINIKNTLEATAADQILESSLLSDEFSH